MTQTKFPPRAILYLVSIWCEDGLEPPQSWRYQIENLHTRSRQSFSEIEDCLAFLEGQIRADQNSRDRIAKLEEK